jgi:hypothetical protein
MCAHAQTSCPLSSLSSAGLPSPMAVSLDQLKVTIKPETSRVDVRITNRDRRPINAMFMLVDFQVSGRYQLSTIFSSSLLPGASYNDWAESTQRALECPDEGRIAVLQIVFASGKPIDYRLPAWWVDPSLLKIDSWSLDAFPTKPVSVSSTLSVNEQGRVRVVAMGVVEPQMSDTAESNLTSWLTDEIERTFEFVPAQYNGALISSELEVLIRFYPIKEIDATISKLPTGCEIDGHNHRFGFDSPGEGIRVNICGIPSLVDSSA